MVVFHRNGLAVVSESKMLKETMMTLPLLSIKSHSSVNTTVCGGEHACVDDRAN